MNGIARPPALAAVFIATLFAAALWPQQPAMSEEPFFPAENNTANADARPLTRPNRPLRQPNAKSGEKPKAPGSAGSLWKTFSFLAVMIVVIVVGAKFLKKHGPRLPGGIPADAMEVLGKRVIDRGQLIYLVRLGSRILIIGSSTSGGLNTLGEVNDPVEIDFLAGLCRQKSETASSISQGFLAMFNRRQFDGDALPQTDAANPPAGHHSETDHYAGSYHEPTTAGHEVPHA